ncbi:MAG: type transport system ATP-binding protein, partial [Solirubrobacteraceae bacterium]|nr:type transport system ATP-binding protein [Solirubrobacteraceae bacterium]
MIARALAASVLAVLVLAAPAAAAGPAPFTSCPAYGDQHICTAEVPSFDGSKLDVDLTLPSGGGGSHPLMIFLHGFGNNKREWESTTDEGDGADKYDWNSHWFARHGFYVLTYTARGFRTADGPSGSQPPTPAGAPNGSLDLPSGTIHIKSREFEIRDTRYLASLVANAFPDVDRNRVAISGGSYGGGESWMQAADPVWGEFADPPLHLQVAVPKYPWTDLGFSLAPNGRTSDGAPDSPTGDGFPIGTPKASYISGLFALGAEKGAFEAGTTTTPSQEGPIDIPLWNTDLLGKGDPYSPEVDPIVRQARRGLTVFRSAYYQDAQWKAQAADPKAAIFSISGWTDDLFEAIESFRMFDYLKGLNPHWPVEVAVADIGHSRAQNPPAQWKRLNAQAWEFLESNLNGAHERSTGVSSMPTLCGDASGDGGARLTGRTPADLASGTLHVGFTSGDTQTQASGADDPDGPATDAIAGGLVAPGSPSDGCTRSARPAGYQTSGYTALSDALPKPRTYVGRGFVSVPYSLAGVTATLHARLWDVAPDGTQLLVTRGTYRIDTLAAGDADPASGTLKLPLYGNQWDLAKDHRLRLDLQEADVPTFRLTNGPNALAFDAPTLELPTREAGDVTVAGG